MISLASRKEFSSKGYHGTSMRDIAKAAGVSEALIYQHFPSKMDLYKEIYFYLDPQVDALCDYLKSFPPSTETLVKIVYSLSMMIMSEVPGQGENQKMFERLLIYSLLENPDFAKSVFKKYETNLSPLWTECIESAWESGEMYKQLVYPVHKMWFVHHLSMAINLLHTSGEKLFNYEGSLDDLINYMVVFVLRGIGLTDEAVQKYAQNDHLRKLLSEIFHPEEGLVFLDKDA